MGPVTGRYAPSPTGALHLGNLRTALAAWLSARAQGGRFLLRIEDIDRARSRAALVAPQLGDLAALGIDWDGEPVLQHTREAAHAEALARLIHGGHAFRCFCTRRDLRAAASAPHEDGGEPPYPGTCAALSPAVAEARAAEGRPFAWRLRVDDQPEIFGDRIQGPQSIRLDRAGGAFVLRRSDGETGYQLACAVDDADQGVTEVVRGADLLVSAARQRRLLRCLGREAPATWVHLPLMVGEDGARLSKRAGAEDLRGWAARGVDAAGVRGYLAWTLGLAEKGERPTAGELVGRFDWRRVPRDPVVVRAGDVLAFAGQGSASRP